MTVTREELFEQIWAEPMTKVAARYSVSSSFLARICHRLGLPRPARGYWAKLAVSKAEARPALPEPGPGDELAWSRGGDSDGQPLPLPKPLPTPRRRSKPQSALPTQHALLHGARQHFLDAKKSDNGYLRPSKRLLVDFFVTEQVLDRTFDFANSLFLAFEGREHRVLFAPRDRPYWRSDVDERLIRKPPRQEHYGYGRWHPARPTVAFVGTVAIGLSVFELSEETEVRYVDGKYIPVAELINRKRRYLDHGWTTKRDLPTGRLSLRASSPYPGSAWEREWPEKKPGDLNHSIQRIVRELEDAAATIANLVEEAEQSAEIERREWEERRRQWEIEERERQQRENREKSTAQLLSIVEAWSLAKRIEDFFEDIEKRLTNSGPEERSIRRLSQARELLGGIDALQRFGEWRSPDDRADD